MVQSEISLSWEGLQAFYPPRLQLKRHSRKQRNCPKAAALLQMSTARCRDTGTLNCTSSGQKLSEGLTARDALKQHPMASVPHKPNAHQLWPPSETTRAQPVTPWGCTISLLGSDLLLYQDLETHLQSLPGNASGKSHEAGAVLTSVRH